MRASLALLIAMSAVAIVGRAAEGPSQQASAQASKTVDSRAVMTGDQVVRILDATVDWYRMLGAQQQAATQPSDLLILYANRQTADKVVDLAFAIARANAELLSSEVDETQTRDEALSLQSLLRQQRRLVEQRSAIQAAIDKLRREVAAAPAAKKSGLSARISALQGELDLVNARRNLLNNMAQFASQSDASGNDANALKAHIDAIEASIPATNPPATATTGSGSGTAGSSTRMSGGATSAALAEFGIWDLAGEVFRLAAKGRAIDAVDRRTAELQDVFTQVSARPLEQLKRLTARGDQLSAQASNTNTANLHGVRDQYDTLAWLFQQTSAIVTPLSNARVLLAQYRRNLGNWREATDKQYGEALRALGLRIALFAALLAVVFIAGQLWRRAVFRYVHEPRRRSRFLLLQRIVFWCLVVAIAASTFATELGSLATFAGLITAGLAVAMQSVLVSIVGYFFLIGRYGIRVGDRVQIGSVTGEVIEMGLVRLHLMELSGEGQMSPTGRVVAFANSIIFQASGGLFKQIPGVDLAWREITLSLPSGVDYAALKDQLVAAVTRALKDYREDIMRQTQEIRKTLPSSARDDPQPQVQLRFSAMGVDAIVRYPVQLTHAAEIDERVSRELLSVVSEYSTTALPAAPPAPA